jgi:signal transduction histidine kinase/ligand-binding sensor domain-containing protein
MYRVICLLLYLIPHSVMAQVLPFQAYTTREGLPSNQINALYQDSRGYLWIGTNNGLSVYDGETLVTYSTADGLTNNWITTVIESRKYPGVMWIGTIAGGVCRFQSGTFTSVETGSTEQSKIITGLIEDETGVLWSVTVGGIYAYDNGGSRHFLPGRASVFSDNLIISPDGTLWSGRGDSLSVFTSDRTIIFSTQLSTHPSAEITAMTAARDGRIFIGTSDSLLYEFRDTTLLFTHTLADGIPHSIREDAQENIWIRTPRYVVKKSANAVGFMNASRFVIDDLLPSDMWAGPLLIDREDNLWIGTWTRGVLKVTEKNSFKLDIETRGDGIAIRNGHMWYISTNGLTEVFRDRDGKWQLHIHDTAEIRNARIFSTHGKNAIDFFGRLWMITSNGSAMHAYEINQKPGLPSELTLTISLFRGLHYSYSPFTFRVDSANRIWIASSIIEVVDLTTLQPFSTFSDSDGVPGTSIRVIYDDTSGNIWAGDFDGGLAVLDMRGELHGQFKKFGLNDGLPDNRIRVVYQDREGKLWVGTRHGGVALFHNSVFRVVSMTDGLRSNSIWNIFDDEYGRLWLVTDMGVECIDRHTLEVLPIKRIPGERLMAAGLFDSQFMYIVSPTSLTMHEYRRETKNAVPPLVHLTSVHINGRPHHNLSEMNLGHNQNNVAFHYGGISFKDEKGVSYRYRLLGLDTTWSAFTSQRSITYAALRPGSYTFEVIAKNVDGVSSSYPATLSLMIASPYWLQWWFIVLVAGSLSMVFWIILRYRINRVVEMERLRARIASDLHDDVGTNLSSILVVSQLLERQESLEEQDRTRIKDIGAITAITQEMLRDIVWMLNPKNDSVEDLLLKMKEYAGRLLHNMDYTFYAPPENLADKLSIEFKRNIYLIFKETLNNIVKHASATDVGIEVRQENHVFSLKIVDNGTGFSSNGTNSGNGLTNIYRRAAHIKAKVHISSVPGEGTTIALSVKNHSNG